MDLFESLATDTTAEETGKWFDLDGNAGIKLRSATSTASKNLRRELEKPYAAQLRLGKGLSEKVSEELFIKQLSGAIIVDWKNITYKKEPLPFSQENAERMLRELPKLREIIAVLITDESAFKLTLAEEQEKN